MSLTRRLETPSLHMRKGPAPEASSRRSTESPPRAVRGRPGPLPRGALSHSAEDSSVPPVRPQLPPRGRWRPCRPTLAAGLGSGRGRSEPSVLKRSWEYQVMGQGQLPAPIPSLCTPLLPLPSPQVFCLHPQEDTADPRSLNLMGGPLAPALGRPGQLTDPSAPLAPGCPPASLGPSQAFSAGLASPGSAGCLLLFSSL